ncbi:hypothetical protein E2562_037158 [Oryza meyeriana var. granulata]|uniref:Aminotransferase-like plant mobile domain-containing protein n=1 Tax=Oryza meyeriana var. granulata TaxID=110450 RepID=A0A6G1CLK0_9ORYZ|nr:hypothetical protein E2562_037158 [Oryza meyeriana var. granulata]
MVLCATYRGLCEATSRVGATSTIVGCPILLQMWAYEHFQIRRPVVDSNPYEYPARIDPVDWPTMWHLLGQAPTYPYYIAVFNQLIDSSVRWELYNDVEVQCRAPQGLSTLCTWDATYWLTRCWLVFDVHVKEYTIH